MIDSGRLFVIIDDIPILISVMIFNLVSLNFNEIMIIIQEFRNVIISIIAKKSKFLIVAL